MYGSSSRPTAFRSLAAIVCIGIASLALAVFSSAANAANAKTAPSALNAELAVCPGQTFAQDFLGQGDNNYYTLVEGSLFEGSAPGWTLLGGAQIVEGTLPGGEGGDELALPAGGVAISPGVCVTLQYPTARAYVESVGGPGGVTVGVAYTSLKALLASKQVAKLASKAGAGWELSQPFNVAPELAGKEEGVREVHFVFANTTHNGDFRLYGVFVDPRLSN